MLITKIDRLARRSFLAAALLVLPGIAAAQEPTTLTIAAENRPWHGDLNGMVERRIIRVLVPYNRTLYFLDMGGRQRGISFDYMQAFENHLNTKLKRGNLRIHTVMIPIARDQLLPALLAGQGDIAAANITITPERQAAVDFTIPLARDVSEVIVTGPKAPNLTRMEDLADKTIFVRHASSYYDSLTALNYRLRQQNLPPITLRLAPGHFETEDMLEMANAGLVDVVVADSYLADLWKHVYPSIRIHENLVVRSGADVAFAIRKNSPKLESELNAFSKRHRQGTTFGNVTLQKYLQNTRWVKNATSAADLQRFDTLASLLQKYGDQYHVDWLLMAALGYQESQLDQSKRSHAGAIGIMQVMPATAKQMRIGNIDQLEPNIHVGVKYVRHLIDTYFDDASVDELNRALFAFASYNAGPTRIRSLRQETKKQGLNPNIWFNNVERVVAQRIGRETVQYVSNIYKYYIAYDMARKDFTKDLARKSP